ncbi:MAG: hypothetical protein J6V15_04875 [Clostridia bacterium]|nr:hypothetical protein [Clostridia bacterium]
MINTNQRKEERMDQFLKSVLEPAAEEYMDELVYRAVYPARAIPTNLDKKCRDIISGKPCCLLKGVIKVILVAAVSVSMMAATSFAVYTGVKKGLLMKLETEPEGSRITFVGEDVETVSAVSSPGKIELSYIPDGFECVKKTDDYVRYADKNGNSFIFKMTNTALLDLMLWDTERSIISPVTYENYEGYKSIIENSVDGRMQISFVLYNEGKQSVYRSMFIGINESEINSILEGINHEVE